MASDIVALGQLQEEVTSFAQGLHHLVMNPYAWQLEPLDRLYKVQQSIDTKAASQPGQDRLDWENPTVSVRWADGRLDGRLGRAVD